MKKISFVRFLFLSALIGSAMGLNQTASAQISDFVEDFENGAAGFAAADDTAVTFFSSGGVGDSAFIRGTSDPNFQGVVIRAENGPTNPNFGSASGGAFTGNFVASQVESLSFDLRHDFGSDLNFAVRFARAGNFPGGFFNVGDIASGSEFQNLEVDFAATDEFGFEGTFTFDSFFDSDIQNIQIFVTDDVGDATFNVDVDNFAIAVAAVPEPSSLAMLTLGLVGIAIRRRR